MSPPIRFLVIALCLAGAAAGARLVEEVAVARVNAGAEEAAVQAAERSLAAVEEHLLRLEHELIQRARRLARDPAVSRALAQPDGRREAVERFDRLSLPDGYAAELYTPLPELIAWSGPGLPLDPATRRLGYLESTQSAVVDDGTRRQALVVWEPVREDGRLLGAVRMVRLLRISVPVQNQYLQDFDLAERWTRGRVPGVRVSFEPPTLPSGDVSMEVAGVDRHPLAYLSATPPPPGVRVVAVRAELRGAAAFFLTLLLGWLSLGLALLAARRFDVAVLEPTSWSVGAAALSATGWVASWIGLRYALVALGVPSRYVLEGPPSPVFDPAFLGSGFGGGVAGSAAELMITAVFAVVAGAAAAYAGLRIAGERRARVRLEPRPGSRRRWWQMAVLAVLAAMGVLMAAFALIHRATEDATLGYFERAGPLPEGLVLFAFAAFLLIALGAVLLIGGMGLAIGIQDRRRALASAALVALTLTGAYLFAGAGEFARPQIAVAFLFLSGAVTAWVGRHPERWISALSVRGALLAVLVLAAITYPVVYGALQTKEEARLRDAVEDFADGEDARAAFALESVLLDARASAVVQSALADAAVGRPLPEGLADSLAADLVTGSLLAALADYRVGLTLLAPDGVPLGRYLEEAPVQIAGRMAPAPMPPDPVLFSRLRRHYEEEALFAGFAVERRPAGRRGGRYRYAGIGPVRDADEQAILGWITARAEPRPARYAAETPFPRVLVPAGLYRLADEEWVFAEFQDGVLHRSRGASFGRFRLPDAVGELPISASTWRNEHLEGQPMRVYYRRLTEDRVVSARLPATTIFDHLYFMLRILAAGLIIVALAHLAGIAVRRGSARLAARPRLRDRVLNRFLMVGLIAVVATGIIGREVIVTQNRDSVEERLKRQLARVEAALYDDFSEEAEAPLPPELILDRARPDVVGPRLGLDVNLYRGAELVASSRSQLVRQRLIEQRLPIEVVRRLFVDGERYAFATERIGRFRYTTGYEAVPDAEGRPAVVIAVPTLPEQFAIEADQARMIAYLFGVLLLLLLLIFVVATVLANRLTQPFRRLREGLRAVGAGEAPAEPIPVERRDEVGEVIETFNAVWEQLEESRRRLAAHERELAWREMARQVAHEIKNPLTPMRLSVQHLRRAHERAEEAGKRDGEFAALFERISNTLLEQIDALNRIAGEFSHFGRLPERHLQIFDLNEVIRQAAALVGEEPQAEISLDLAREPLPVRADREELRRVYINLLKNAQQAIPADEHGLITITSKREAAGDADDPADGWAFSEVRDTGVGIPEDARPRIFQPNFSTKTSGMGLGLAIARKAVEDLGGEISFATEPGVGTSFCVRLRLADEANAVE